MEITFTVPGVPQPKGSMRPYRSRRTGKLGAKNDNPRTKPWQTGIAKLARAAMGHRPPLTGAVTIEVKFYMERPAHLDRGRDPDVPTVYPDSDKLVRALFDALKQAAVWADDGQGVHTVATKVYAGQSFDERGVAGRPRARVTVRPFTAADAQMRIEPAA